jgi:hypothetical protein
MWIESRPAENEPQDQLIVHADREPTHSTYSSRVGLRHLCFRSSLTAFVLHESAYSTWASEVGSPHMCVKSQGLITAHVAHESASAPKAGSQYTCFKSPLTAHTVCFKSFKNQLSTAGQRVSVTTHVLQLLAYITCALGAGLHEGQLIAYIIQESACSTCALIFSAHKLLKSSFTSFKGIVPRESTEVESGISRKVFLSHWTADILFFNLKRTCFLNRKKTVSAA